MSIISDANDIIRRLEAELAASERYYVNLAKRYADALVKARSAARTERLRIADRAEVMIKEYRANRMSSLGLEALFAELRGEGDEQ